MRKLLQKAGLRLTLPRRLVMKTLEEMRAPMTAQEIYHHISQVDLASVYRTLHLFCRLGLVYKESHGEETRFYVAYSPHHHITCRECGQTECVPCNHILKTIKGFSDIEHQFILTGLCQKCHH